MIRMSMSETHGSVRSDIYQLQHNVSNGLFSSERMKESLARTSHELEGLGLTFTIRHGCDNALKRESEE